MSSASWVVRFARYSAQELATASRSLSVANLGGLDGRTEGDGPPAMTSKWYQEKRRKLPQGHRPLDEYASAQPRGMEMPAGTAGLDHEQPPLDPGVVKLIDALARAQAKEDHDRENTPQSVPPPR
jgi:hypothetical protein